MKREHLTKHPLDDEISRRGLDLFIKSLDGMKLYFYQSDIDEFNQKQNDLDDMVAGRRRQLRLHGLQPAAQAGRRAGGDGR